MNPLTRDFLHRWRWIFLFCHFATTAFVWKLDAMDRKPLFSVRLHLEIFPAIALSFDLARGLLRPGFGLPMNRAVFARGLWLSVVATGPLLLLGTIVLAGVLCFISGKPMPAPGVISFHLTLSVLIAGTAQFLLSSMPVQPSTTIAGKITGIVLGSLWGLSISTPFWISNFIPSGWAAMGTASTLILSLLTALTVASWFTTQRMITERVMVRSSSSPGMGLETPMTLAGSGGWSIWWRQEANAIAFVGAMAVMVIVIQEIMMGSFRSGVSDAMKDPSNAYLTLGMVCAMMMTPLFARAAGGARLLRALPISGNRLALILAARPAAYALFLFASVSVYYSFMGRWNGQEGRAVCVFIFIGGLLSIMQAINVRHPSTKVTMAMAMFLSPGVVLTSPVVVDSAYPVLWLGILGIALLPVSWLLCRRWMRTSSGFYRQNGWPTRLTAANVR